MVLFDCPACQKKLTVHGELAGTRAPCPSCGQVVPVHALVAVAPSTGAILVSSPQPTPPPADIHSTTYTRSEKSASTEGVDRPTEKQTSELTAFLSPPQSDDELGRLGKYRILKILGHGGMGVVFLAEDAKLRRLVAIKSLLPNMASSSTAGQRFVREAQAMAALKHDHVVTIFQVDEEAGIPFLAMELLQGEPLDGHLLRNGTLSLSEVLRIGREIAEGLEAAHAIGLIHRDIKPANIWLEAPRSRVKILDFGLARAASQHSGLTQQGAILGTPAYMAPEQARGETVDARCDLFSLGVVLYQLCTGQAPFKGKDPISTLVAVATHAPSPPALLDVRLPRQLSDLVMSLLEKEAAQRPASASAVAEVLRAVERDLARKEEAQEKALSIRPVATGTASKRKWKLLALTLALAALIPLLWWLSSHPKTATDSPTNAIPKDTESKKR